jgi:hypothetical protein
VTFLSCLNSILARWLNALYQIDNSTGMKREDHLKMKGLTD